MGADGVDRLPHAFALAATESARQRSLSVAQWVAVAGLVIAASAGFWLAPQLAGQTLIWGAQAAFAVSALWRIILIVAGLRRVPPPPYTIAPSTLPTYAVMVALHDEADIVPQLITALSAIDYPSDRLEGFLLLETHDAATLAAIQAVDIPHWLRVLVVPPGKPQTKPRALNYGLTHCRADIVTVYDAEDRPDPQQLREAAARFAADRSGRLACLQAPLRIRRSGPTRSPFLDRQFAVEYAALFEVTLPGLARLGLPFPLGGTSNHFRVDVLRRVGGWDAYNVTEDADLGFRLHTNGWRMDVITRPTIESPPGDLQNWLPQRARWMKGFMQTWGVHTRRPWRLGWRGALSLTQTLGLALASAAVHAPSVMWVCASLLVAAAYGLVPAVPPTALGVLSAGVLTAWLSAGLGASRAGVPFGPSVMVQSPAYWSLLSIALVHAAWRLATQPFAWDKTPHQPDGTLPPRPRS